MNLAATSQWANLSKQQPRRAYHRSNWAAGSKLRSSRSSRWSPVLAGGAAGAWAAGLAGTGLAKLLGGRATATPALVKVAAGAKVGAGLGVTLEALMAAMRPPMPAGLESHDLLWSVLAHPNPPIKAVFASEGVTAY
eukprot:scaffold26890_cov46-Prasinocladus_malaysianus.AAC.2